MQDLNWNDLRFILALARHRTFAGAARQLSVNESTVARRIAHAEQQLGAQLFERSPGALHITEAGARVVSGAEHIELEIQAISGSVSGADRLTAGTVRLTSVPLIVNRILIPALPKLLQRHPQLRIELIAEPRALSLSGREADIALRLARPDTDMRAVTRRIGRLDYAVYGPATGDCTMLPWIVYEDSMAGLPQSRWLAQRSKRDRVGIAPLIVNDAEAILHGIKAGLGKSLLPVAVGGREPGLLRLDEEAAAVPVSRELWLMVHPDLRHLSRIRVVMDWLLAVAAEYRF